MKPILFILFCVRRGAADGSSDGNVLEFTGNSRPPKMLLQTLLLLCDNWNNVAFEAGGEWRWGVG